MLDWVNPLQGTDSHYALSKGNTLPLIGPPWPMTHWSPQTLNSEVKEFTTYAWWFQSFAKTFTGFRATRQPSPWMGDYGHFTIMPQTGELKADLPSRASAHDLAASTVRPDYVRMHLSTYSIDAELTASERCGVMRFTFLKGDVGRIIFDPASVSHVEIDGRSIRGYTTSNSGGVPADFKAYFVAKLDRNVTAFGTVDASGKATAGAKAIDGDGIRAYVEFSTKNAPAVTLTVATSYISYEQAELNLNHEAADGFDAVRARTAKIWEDNLARITITGGTPDQRRTFYSCFYRAQTFPHKFHELDASGKPHHFGVYDSKVHPGIAYTDIGFWDVYRTNFTLWSLVFPEVMADIMDAFVITAEEAGWYPQWPSPGHRVSMIGSHIDAVYADAIAKGIGTFDKEKAYKYLRKNAFDVPPNGTVGRVGFADYAKLGYVPAEKEAGYTLSCTLDYAYDDWCLAQVAKSLGRDDDYKVLSGRATNYKQMFDSSVGFFRPKTRDGQWFGQFDEYAWSTGYVEGGPWQCSWAVQHDVEGLAELHGGRDKLGNKLDQMMGMPPIFHVGEYRNVIHEMTEMAVVPFGQYAHSNQPVHHVLYLFAAIGQPEKTQYWTRRVCQDLYGPGTNGFPGDEDNGEMGAWYVLSSLGLYQLCVGDPKYTLTSPLFDSAEIKVGDGKTLTIRTINNAPHHHYTRGRTLDGKPYAEHTIDFARLQQGGELVVQLAPQPA